LSSLSATHEVAALANAVWIGKSFVSAAFRIF
jgi:hypothetical protein